MTEHPDHDCEDCGHTHTAYSAQIDYAKKQNKTRNILIAIICISLISIPIGFTIVDLVKEPSMLDSKIDYNFFKLGYDVVCFADDGMQYCVVDSNESNQVAYNSERLVLQVKSNPCLNVNIGTPEKTTNAFHVTDGELCVGSLEFPIQNGWTWKEESITVGDGSSSRKYFIGKSDTTFWWDDLKSDLESMTFTQEKP